MLSVGAGRRVFLARAPQDMRRGMDALSAVVRNEHQRDPTAGDMYIFLSRNRRRLKVLVYESGGYWLGMKRLDRGTFARLGTTPPSNALAIELSPTSLAALLEGLDIQVVRERRREQRVVDTEGAIKYRRDHGG